MSDKSNFAKQWKWISGERSDFSEKEAMEFSQFESQELPTLVLRSKKKNGSLLDRLRGVVWLAPALALGVILWLNPPVDQLRTKGSVLFKVFQIGKDGDLKFINHPVDLKDGDRVGFELKINTNGIGFWGIVDYKDSLIHSKTEFLNNKIQLSAGELFRFNSLLELTPPNQGEKLLIVVCDENVLVDTSYILAKVGSAEFLKNLSVKQESEENGCLYRLFQLREFK